ncbi:MAG TPA: hypothetical protein VG963_21485 [Polyangiaceae bacterium]|nr:hypothetical protein [Polyangiaceae bacterium]
MNVWLSHATGIALHRLTLSTREMMAKYPHGFSTVHIITGSAGLPDADARAGFIRLSNECVRELACVGVIIGGSGFWASALRAAVTGIWQALPKSFDMGICGTSEEVAEWLVPRHLQRTGAHLPPESLVAVLNRATEEAANGALTQQSA